VQEGTGPKFQEGFLAMGITFDQYEDEAKKVEGDLSIRPIQIKKASQKENAKAPEPGSATA
jgi:hypothetical protein